MADKAQSDPHTAGYDTADIARHVEWYRDLLEGNGASQVLEDRLRRALALATVDVALERAVPLITAERERAERAERAERQRAQDAERQRTQAREHALADKRREEAQLRRIKDKRYWVIAAWAAALTLWPVVPVLIGQHTRDWAFRQRATGIYNTTPRDDGLAYFGTDWLAGAVWMAVVSGLVLLLVARRDWRRRGFGLARVVLAWGVIGLAVPLAWLSAQMWSSSETDLRAVLTHGAVPEDVMFCPGVALPGTLATDEGASSSETGPATVTLGSTSWRAQVRTLANVDATGTSELGACLYAGWNYVGTFSLGRVPGPLPRQLALHLLVDGTSGIVTIESAAPDTDTGLLYGTSFTVPPHLRGPLTRTALADATPPASGSPVVLTRNPTWTAALNARSTLTIRAADGPRWVVGPVTPGTTGDLLSIDPAGALAVIAPGVTSAGWTVIGGTVYLVRGALPSTPGTAIVELGPDLTVVWEAPCPAGGPVTMDADGEGFSCGVRINQRADLFAREWVKN